MYKVITSGKVICVLLGIFVKLCFPLAANASMPEDSVGVEKKGSKNYILHKVESKETLFAISRKYKVTVDQLKASNADIKSGLSVGQIIRVPYKPNTIKEEVASEKTHKVASKETLFSISKKYKVSVEDLKKANPGIAKGLKVGQEITIPGKAPAQGKTSKTVPEPVVAKKTETKEEPKTQPKEDVQTTVQPVKDTKPTNTDDSKKESLTGSKSLSISMPSASSNTSYKKVNEAGFANVMENSPSDLKYLAQHKTAPIGTIIQVRNEDNNQKIFVRVSGKLTSNPDKVILRISPQAFERLGAKGDKIPVTISYIP